MRTTITSTKEFSEWEKIFGDRIRAGAAIDRLLAQGTIINVTGSSSRLKDKTKQRTQKDNKRLAAA